MAPIERDRWLVPLVFGVVLPLASCSGEAGVGPRVTTRDSAGIGIVANSGVAAVSVSWSVSPEPIFRIGWGEGDPQFQNVQSGGIGTDRTVVVGDMGSGLVYILDAGGSVVTTVGGPGEGPGEIARLETVLALGGDSILVADGGNRRVALFEGERHLSDRRFENIYAEATYGPIARLADGSFLLTPSAFALRMEETEHWKSYPVLTTEDFLAVDTVSVVPLLQVLESGDWNPLRHLGGVVRAGGGIAYARSDRAEATWMDLEGRVTRIARWDETPRVATEQDWNRFEEAYRERLGEDISERQEENLRNRREGFGGTLPLFRFVLGDPSGNVWLGEYRLADPTASVYRIISSSGEWLGSITFPRDILILDITDTHVLGVETNELDVQAVALYELVKPE